MEAFDYEKAARVWRRIRGAGESDGGKQSLQQLIAEEWSDAVTLLELSRRFRGQQARHLRQLAHREQTHASWLRGIYAQTSGCRPAVSAKPLTLKRTENLLRRCYDRQQRRLAEYEARSGDPKFGHVYTRLATQEQSHCQTLLELLGQLPRQG